MSEVQVIEKDGRPAFYVVHAALWDKVREVMENAEDAAAFNRAMAGDGSRIPAAVAYAIADGAHPVCAWRKHLGLRQDALAAAGISTPFLSQIESGKRVGTLATLKKLARAMNLPFGVLS